jgi:hypothetical protein
MLLEKRQGLLIPWSFEREDYDYLRVLLRPVAVPAASAVNPSSDLESFAVAYSQPCTTFLCHEGYRTDVSVRYAVIQ